MERLGRRRVRVAEVVDAFLDALAELLGRCAKGACELWELRCAEDEQDHDQYHDELWSSDVSNEGQHSVFSLPLIGFPSIIPKFYTKVLPEVYDRRPSLLKCSLRLGAQSITPVFVSKATP